MSHESEKEEYNSAANGEILKCVVCKDHFKEGEGEGFRFYESEIFCRPCGSKDETVIDYFLTAIREIKTIAELTEILESKEEI